jgi:hypothetical protein
VTASPLGSRRAKLHLVVGLVVVLGLPAGSLIAGDGVFAWTMFSKSETYRLKILGVLEDGATRTFDPRGLGPFVNPSLASFLPAADTWRHDPVGLTFRTGLPTLARVACRLGPLRATELTLEERRTLDDAPRVSVARASCP